MLQTCLIFLDYVVEHDAMFTCCMLELDLKNVATETNLQIKSPIQL